MRLLLAFALALCAVPVSADDSAGGPAMRAYRLKGAGALMPVAIGDDGARTFIQWRADQPMPATFAVGPGGREEIVEGHVRAGVYTIDRVYDRLVFRLDKLALTAQREAR